MSTTPALLSPDLVRHVRTQYTLPWRGVHGVTHWARVLENGLRMAPMTGARPQVVALFALFHDSRRFNECLDPDHGRRGAELASLLRGSVFELCDGDFALLRVACEYHTDGLTDADPTIQTCWDADRLDLGRVGIRPNPRRLCTAAARDPEVRRWAFARSHERHEPEFISRQWGSP